MNQSIQYAAQLKGVREVSLVGTADLGYWGERLRSEALSPAEENGHATLLIIAAEGKFLGITFRELSFSIAVQSERESKPRPATYLIGSFSSIRLFAFCERVLFSTPYQYGDVRVSATARASSELFEGQEPAFQAHLNFDPARPARECTREAEECWEGPVFLPALTGSKVGGSKLFFATLRGKTRTYPFRASHDTLLIRPPTEKHILQTLLDSRFVPQEWQIREDAFHAKSKTYPRETAFAGPVKSP